MLDEKLPRPNIVIGATIHIGVNYRRDFEIKTYRCLAIFSEFSYAYSEIFLVVSD